VLQSGKLVSVFASSLCFKTGLVFAYSTHTIKYYIYVTVNVVAVVIVVVVANAIPL